MPLYLVRHKEAKMSLVHADTLPQLHDMLDKKEREYGRFNNIPYQSAAPPDCTIHEYKKPVHFTFSTESPVVRDRYFSMDFLEEPDTTAECLDFNERLLNEGLYSDVTLVVEGHEFHCHKAILMNRCDYFKTMFESGMKESSNDKIPIIGHSLVVMKQVLRFIYTGRVTIPRLNEEGKEMDSDDKSPCDETNMADFFGGLLRAADFYSLDSLGKVSDRKIAEYCHTEDGHSDFLCPMFDLAVEHNRKDLKNMIAGKFCQFIEEHKAYSLEDHITSPELVCLINHLRPEFKNKAVREFIKCVVPNGPNPEGKHVLEIFFRKCRDKIGKSSCAFPILCQVCMENHDQKHTWESWQDVFILFFVENWDVNAANTDGDTALHIACQGDTEKVMPKPRLAFEVLQWLLKHGADSTVVNQKGRTPLDELYHHLDLGLPMIAQSHYNKKTGVFDNQIYEDFHDQNDLFMMMKCLLESATEDRQKKRSKSTEQSAAFLVQVKTDEDELKDKMETDSGAENFDQSDMAAECDGASDFKPEKRFVFNPEVVSLAKNLKGEDRQVVKFNIRNFIGDNTFGARLEQFEEDMLEVMYPRFSAVLKKQPTTEDMTSTNLNLEELEAAAINDAEAAAKLCGSGLPLQSTTTLARFDRRFKKAVTKGIVFGAELLMEIERQCRR